MHPIFMCYNADQKPSILRKLSEIFFFESCCFFLCLSCCCVVCLDLRLSSGRTDNNCCAVFEDKSQNIGLRQCDSCLSTCSDICCNACDVIGEFSYLEACDLLGSLLTKHSHKFLHALHSCNAFANEAGLRVLVNAVLIVHILSCLEE